MRRTIAVLAGVGMLAATVVGCHHTAGVCDCDPRIPGCQPPCPLISAPAANVQPIGEPIKMPREATGAVLMETPQF